MFGNDLQMAVDILTNADRVAVLTGAGVSKESGVPTFREAQTGLWAQYDPQQLATPMAFTRHPDLVWSWYMYRYRLTNEVEPNPGHYALVELEKMFARFVILTQNVDGLHKRAGSQDVVELHGNLQRFKCFGNCQGNPTIIELTPAEDQAQTPPSCPHCNEWIRPDVVWFTESLPSHALSRAFSESEECDVMLVVGTSGVVHPAASLPSQARQSGASIIDINPQPSAITSLADVYLQGLSGEVLPQLATALKKN